ncbi:hypothetical protein D3C72_2370960 [compost metagenome]
MFRPTSFEVTRSVSLISTVLSGIVAAVPMVIPGPTIVASAPEAAVAAGAVAAGAVDC